MLACLRWGADLPAGWWAAVSIAVNFALCDGRVTIAVDRVKVLPWTAYPHRSLIKGTSLGAIEESDRSLKHSGGSRLRQRASPCAASCPCSFGLLLHRHGSTTLCSWRARYRAGCVPGGCRRSCACRHSTELLHCRRCSRCGRKFSHFRQMLEVRTAALDHIQARKFFRVAFCHCSAQSWQILFA